jgi:glucose-6-phosphate 1-epimerase
MIRILNLQSKSYVDKTRNASTHTESSPAISITQETDRVYQSLDPSVPIVVTSTVDNSPIFIISREGLNDIVLWNPWIDKVKGMADFSPEDGFRNMICVEAGSVVGWQMLEPGEAWEGGQTIQARL